MKIYTTYKVKIKGFNHIFKDTISIYREAVDYLLTVCYDNWDKISQLNGNRKLSLVERLVHRTKDNPHPAYDFDSKFYKLPSYLRRGCKKSSQEKRLRSCQKARQQVFFLV